MVEKMKRIMSLLLTMLLVLVCIGGALADSVPAPTWLNPDIIGSVTADTPTDPTDNFHLHVNKDWLISAVIKETARNVTPFSQRDDEVKAQIKQLMTDETLTGHEAEIVQTMYQMYTDMEARNALGMEPVLPYLKEIEAIDSMEALDAFLVANEAFAEGYFGVSNMADIMDNASKAVYVGVGNFLLGDADEYKELTAVGQRKKEGLTTLLTALLERCGYSAAESAHILEETFRIEMELGKATMGSEAQMQPNFIQMIYNPKTLEELKAIAPNLPIGEMLQKYTNKGVDRFILMEPEGFKKLSDLYIQDNLEAFKAALIVQTLGAVGNYLDQICIDLGDEYNSFVNGRTMRSDVEEDALSFCSANFDMAIGRMYADAFVSPEIKEQVTQIVHDVVAVYKGRLEKIDWLSAETRQKAIEKLDAMRIRVAYPDDWSLYDYDGLALLNREEGGTLVDNVVRMILYGRNKAYEEFFEPVNKEKWTTSPQTVNAFYNFMDNSINMPAGILGGVFYREGGSYEEMLGGVGVIIGHEITHGFDTMGSQYDADGNYNNWWTDEDRAAFDARTQKVNDYFSAIEVLPGEYVNGLLTIGETVADLGGMSCMLEIAKSREGFDYAAFFSAYAQVWAIQQPVEVEQIHLQDAHPPYYLRTNVTVQQFEEFYETFGVEEGDGMYLAPEHRLNVW